MRAVAGGAGAPSRPAPRGRLLWLTSGVLTCVLLAAFLAHLFVRHGDQAPQGPFPQSVTGQAFTVSQPVTSLEIQGAGAPVLVAARAGSHQVQVNAMVTYDPSASGPPAIVHSVSRERLTLAAPDCQTGPGNCYIAFAVTVPPDVTVAVSTDGQDVSVSGVAGAHLDTTGGGPGTVSAASIHGPLTVATDGGDVEVAGLTGRLYASTNGGQVVARGVSAPTVTADTGGGDAQIGFTTAPEAVLVNTDGGSATLAVPGGPYSVAADSNDTSQQVMIATDPAARQLINVSTNGGNLLLAPGSYRLPAPDIPPASLDPSEFAPLPPALPSQVMSPGRPAKPAYPGKPAPLGKGKPLTLPAKPAKPAP